ncbi:helix-turn-helix domain-containing protein [Pseudomonas asiatica]|uniref:helix-turn-helix domain-containing protein n=1 Tax=Pseudomonas asiatica TaxID=2219225 RepID=UPI001E5B641D|nr:helix-turn-helix domain-containing protein [Pseudomonas asiatica]MCE0757107.1 helix-turn-helix domain-containing protein [Pseudomonas asiatica]MCE1032743.1 helix-turn-helix domain-containing protein [Pseudomonas asiatica]MCE1067442.1 helix-turn-helix domain-containing protein [Pseudomonas asiatica]MCE1102091.1 helix-turn-helix domain-containing protein [Pseudomonas asiatica]MCE1107646.1 helix-turn-helix domain-containing protein [Pseudomonas asiatica]
MTTELAAALIDLRGRKNFTQQDLGKAAGVSPSQISRYESGLAMPRKTVLKKLADALGVTVEGLLNGTASHDEVVELIYDVEFKGLGNVRCSLHFSKPQHRQLAEKFTTLDHAGRQELLGSFMVKALGEVPEDVLPSSVIKTENPISSATARFSAPDEYIKEIQGDPLFEALHKGS